MLNKMALTTATLQQLQAALTNLIDRTAVDRPSTAQLFQLMYNTGLRIREVLEVDRWQFTDEDDFIVHLEKREGTRRIPISKIPDALADRYIYQQPFVMETYSAVNNTFKYYGPGVLFGADGRPTTCHAFRYQYMKQLSEDGLTVTEIGAIMGHVNQANTANYIQAGIRLSQ